MSQRETLPGRPALADLQQIDAVCDRFEEAWRTGSGQTWPSFSRKCRPMLGRSYFATS